MASSRRPTKWHFPYFNDELAPLTRFWARPTPCFSVARPTTASPGHRLTVKLTRRNLIDEYRLIMYPVTLGAGRRLFDGCHTSLELVEQQPMSKGVILLTYRPAAGA